MISKKTSHGGSLIALMTSLALVTTHNIAEEKSEFPITLDTITVTAQKRPEDLAKVPISVNVISAEKIEDLAMQQVGRFIAFRSQSHD